MGESVSNLPQGSRRTVRVARRMVGPLQAFVSTEVSGGLVLLAAAGGALAWANSPWDDAYAGLFGERITIDGGVFHIDETLRAWINDGLMTFFFFVAGLEIKRELTHGELAGLDRAALPAIAAIGGMAVPALIFVSINLGGNGERGWGIPMATDIAFALGILALLGRRIPSQLRVFLLALAIVDDIGAILVIAVFYSSDVQFGSLAMAGGFLALAFALQRAGVRWYAAYFAIGAAMWVAMFESGIHATLAGVALGMLTPATAAGDKEPPLETLERRLHPFTSFLVVPLFALANAGVSLGPDSVSLTSSVTLGVAIGLLVGKPLGIFGATWLAVRTRLASLPEGIGWSHILGIGLLGGVGFTVALFVNELAFGEPALISDGKIGILLGSLLSGAVGYAVLHCLTREARAKP